MQMPGLSLISYVRDRSGHLARSLPRWCAAPEIAEIIVVDYGSAQPVDPALLAGDRRCRLIRVENAPYWKQGKAENLGIAEAAGPLILKLDADTYIPPDRIPALLTLAQGQFVTGRVAASQSGQALFWKADWAALGGYHEFMSGWGYDDCDFYRRLLAAGRRRFEFGAAALRTIEHEDELRMAGGLRRPTRLNIPDEMLRHKEFSNARNKVLAYLVPWTEALREIPTRIASGRIVTLAEPGALEHAAVETASFFAACQFMPEFGRAVFEGLEPFFGLTAGSPAPEALLPPVSARLNLPPALTGSSEFIRLRGAAFARLVPRQPQRPLSARDGGLGQHLLDLAPPSPLEIRAAELASVIAAAFFVGEKARWLDEWLRILFFRFEIDLGPAPILAALA